MQFFGYTLADETVPFPEPTQEQMAAMGKFVQEAMDAGVILATGGMAPTAMGVKVTSEGGEYSVVDGPFAEAKEIVGGWVLYNVDSMDEAVEWSKRFLAVLGTDAEVRIRPTFGPE
ncbi:MAG TPA: YciI family protein [Pseudonocardiaceae bacterium]|nr:YciI family protein [Pseudonocardiaceae bacterium]